MASFLGCIFVQTFFKHVNGKVNVFFCYAHGRLDSQDLYEKKIVAFEKLFFLLTSSDARS
jgi:hypothetical protein